MVFSFWNKLTYNSSYIAGFPQSYYYGHENGYNILVIDLLGPNLDELFNLCDKQFSPKTVCMIAKKMVGFIMVFFMIKRNKKTGSFISKRYKT